MKKKLLLLIFLLTSLLSAKSQNKITFKTTKAIGEKININVEPQNRYKSNIWIDLNNNNIKDTDESITNFEPYKLIQYTIQSQTITIYGDVIDLECSANQITSIDLSNNTNLKIFSCANSLLTTLDLSKNEKLTLVNCRENKIKTLNLKNNPLLTTLCCGYNELTSLNINYNPRLYACYCQKNQLKYFYTIYNKKLKYLDVSANPLIYLNIANSNNEILKEFYSLNNSKLGCIQIDNYFTPTNSWKKDTHTNWSNTACPEYVGTTHIVINTKTLSLDLFGTKKIEAITYPQNATIKDIKWTSTNDKIVSVDKMGNISTLAIGNADIIAKTVDGCFKDTCHVNVVQPKSITFTTSREIGKTIEIAVDTDIKNRSNIWIDLNNNQIKDVGEAITKFNVYTKKRYTIQSQTISIYGNIHEFNCEGNEVTSINLSKNKELLFINCCDSKLTELDISKNSKLNHITCNKNQIRQLDLNNNPELEYLYCDNNALSILDISNNPKMIEISCIFNQLNSFDISKNKKVKQLLISYNQLTYLNAANSNNENFKIFTAAVNPKLNCIQIDDNFTPTEKWNKDAHTNWSIIPCESVISVDKINTHTLNIWTLNEILHISNLKINQLFSITDISGKLIYKQQAQTNEVNIPVQQGFYIIKVNNQSFKIIVTK